MSTRPLAIVLAAAVLSACQIQPAYEPPPRRPERPLPEQPPPESPPPAETPAPTPPAPTPPAPVVPPPKQFRLGPASAALVAQAQAQSASGNFGLAAATIERALRIEPDNPLLWIELGRVRQAEGNHAQADAMGRRALALATGDPRAQSAAWRLIAESLRARQRNQEARVAEERAAAAMRAAGG